jgi:hypothetical protein
VFKDSLATQQSSIQEINQIMLGTYVDWRWQVWRIISSVVHVTNRKDRNTHSSKQSFATGYLQVESAISYEWMLYARVEGITEKEHLDYLALFTHSVLERQLAGLRYDFFNKNALTLEFARAEAAMQEFDQAMLQWSAVFS